MKTNCNLVADESRHLPPNIARRRDMKVQTRGDTSMRKRYTGKQSTLT